MPAPTTHDLPLTQIDALRGVPGRYGVSLSVVLDSDVYIMPAGPITGIGAYLSGTGTLQYCFDAPAVVAAGNANWIEWNGTAELSTAITAFYAKRTSGTVVLVLSARAGFDSIWLII